MLAVAAVDGAGNLADFSNFGASAVDIAAPGVSILTAASSGGYAGTKGTSIATPFVSGAAALLLSQNLSMTPAQVKTAIVGTARALSGLSGKVASGGTLDLKAALASVGVSVPSSAPAAASPTPPSGAAVAPTDKSASSASGKSGGCSLVR
jgi:subtilisin family serine protease